MGYAAGAEAYRRAAAEVTPESLSAHYTDGLGFFRGRVVPHVRAVLEQLSGGVWRLSDFEGFAAGSDVDLMAHVVNSVAVEARRANRRVCLYPGDWYGFAVGAADPDAIAWDASARDAALACVCVPSVRNGHFTAEMAAFVARAPSCLLNLNLFPTLAAPERRAVAESLGPVLDRALLSVSFSRGFGLTASQLGVLLVHKGHPLLADKRHRTRLEWFTYFYNALAARAFMALDRDALAEVDARRRDWVARWLAERGLPAIDTGSYYVRAFRPEGDPLPPRFAPLVRDDGLVRLCMKPPAGG